MRPPMERRWVFDGDALAYATRRAGMSVRRAAELAGVSQASASLLLHGRTRNPQATTLLQLADVLGVDPHDLMREAEPWE